MLDVILSSSSIGAINNEGVTDLGPLGVPGLAPVEADGGHQGPDTLNPPEAGGRGQPQQHRRVTPHEGGRRQPSLAPSLLPRDEELDNSETMIEINILRIRCFCYSLTCR